MFKSLSVRNYRLFAAGQAVSNTGTWMQRIAQDWVVLGLTHNSGTALGTVTALQFLSVVAFSVWGGSLADRWDRRKLLMITQALLGLGSLTLGLLVVSGRVTIWEVYAIALAVGTASAVDNPTRQTFVGELVGSDLLPNAVSLNSAVFNLARMAGPALAGVLIPVVGSGWVTLANAGSYAAVLLGLALMRPGELVRRPARERGARAFRQTLAFIRTRPAMALVMVQAGLTGMFGLNTQITTALMATGAFHARATGFGLLTTAFALGSLGGALAAARRREVGAALVLTSAAVTGGLELLSAAAPDTWAFAALLVPTGAAAFVFITSANTTTQLSAPDHIRGRVMGVYMLVYLGGVPIGAQLTGWLGQVCGPRWTLALGGAVTAATAGIASVVLRRFPEPPVTDDPPAPDRPPGAAPDGVPKAASSRS
ncbi:MFS transporter [Kitasatospora viridis]